MAPQKFSSVRYKSRPATLVPFRDDSSLIAFRYDETVQAEPPIPIPPPRSPLRHRPATATTATIPSGSRSATTSPTATAPRPLLRFPVSIRNSSASSAAAAAASTPAPPPRPPPPTEQHPALRTITSAPAIVRDAKRDPAPTPAASPQSCTLYDESEDEDQDPFPYERFESVSDARPSPSSHVYAHAHNKAPAAVPRLQLRTRAISLSLYSNDDKAQLSPDCATNDSSSQYSVALPSPGFSEEDEDPATSPNSPSTPPLTAEMYPDKPEPLFAKSFSFRSTSSSSSAAEVSATASASRPRKLTKKRTGARPAAAAMQPVGAEDDTIPAMAAQPIRKQPASPTAHGGSPAVPGSPGPDGPPPCPPEYGSTMGPRESSGLTKTASNTNTAAAGGDFSDFITHMSFSNRGSIMLGGKRPTQEVDGDEDAGAAAPDAPADGPKRTVPRAFPLAPSPMPKTQVDGAGPDEAPSKPKKMQGIPDAIAEEASVRSLSPRASGADQHPPPPTTPTAASSSATAKSTDGPSTPKSPHHPPSIRVIPVDVERESQKVRSLYESGDGLKWEDGGPPASSLGGRRGPAAEVPSNVDEHDAPSPSQKASGSPGRDPSPPGSPTRRPGTRASEAPFASPRDEYGRRVHEMAGGIEDWEDVYGDEVDRYGFITIRRPQSRASTPAAVDTRLGQYSPTKRRNVLVRRDLTAHSGRPWGRRGPSRKMSARSLNTQASEMSTSSHMSTRSAIRQAVNLLPHKRDRRWIDAAADMLALEPGLTNIGDDSSAGALADEYKHKEWERTEKWRRMATQVKPGKEGEGTVFEFDTRNPKLVERTWKGIPDCWRAAAWWSFLSASVKKSKQPLATDEELFASYQELQELVSPDDVQIDLDVPRTINQHIMFRRRYRGGQRLLFRVLHALSLYFPETGYVQGMAALAATLLSYYEEERCFVMLVRLWQVRGLNRLYSPGFEELMTALKDFESSWLGDKDVAKKLQELCIDPTAYATRWYLTLFNLSIPFPAQLRVWDVFMLLGDLPAAEQAPSSGKSVAKPPTSDGLEILHATSTAIILALRDHIIDSEFENAMKAVTSWIPIKNEDLLMKVIQAEYRQHQSRMKKS